MCGGVCVCDCTRACNCIQREQAQNFIFMIAQAEQEGETGKESDRDEERGQERG